MWDRYKLRGGLCKERQIGKNRHVAHREMARNSVPSGSIIFLALTNKLGMWSPSHCVRVLPLFQANTAESTVFAKIPNAVFVPVSENYL